MTTTTHTLSHLLRFEHVSEVLNRLYPDDVYEGLRVRDFPGPHEYIEAAVRLLQAITPAGPASIDEPLPLVNLRNEGWRSIVLAAYEAAGRSTEAGDLAGMTDGQLAGELEYVRQ